MTLRHMPDWLGADERYVGPHSPPVRGKVNTDAVPDSGIVGAANLVGSLLGVIAIAPGLFFKLPGR